MEDLLEGIPEELVQHLAKMARVLGTLDAVVAMKTTDPDQLAKWLYAEKEMCLPLNKMREIAEESLMVLRADGLIVNDEPIPEAVALSLEHQRILHSDQLPN